MTPDAFDYALPQARIAQRPAERRGDARLLLVGPPHRESTAARLPAHVPARALVVTNASRVVRARIRAVRSEDGRTFELLVCDPSPGAASLSAWVRGAKRLHPGDLLAVPGTDLRLRYESPDAIDPRARRLSILAGELMAALHAAGAIPLPPYIRREADADDVRRYQTVFATEEGSVAAPTAGLHLTSEVLATLDHVSILLHVGPGTFLPMQAADVADHRVGAERIAITAAAAERIQAARAEGRPIVAIGTTVVRALEGLARLGPITAGQHVTDLVITPGFDFRVVTHLQTNFHLPRSSLLMLTCAFGGKDRVMAAYRHAVAEGFRFYSYGDCMLVARDPDKDSA